MAERKLLRDERDRLRGVLFPDVVTDADFNEACDRIEKAMATALVSGAAAWWYRVKGGLAYWPGDASLIDAPESWEIGVSELRCKDSVVASFFEVVVDSAVMESAVRRLLGMPVTMPTAASPTTKAKRKTGPESRQTDRVVEAMKKDIRAGKETVDTLNETTGEALAVTYRTSRTTAGKALTLVLSEFAESTSESH